MSFSISIVTSTGCIPDGNPFGKRVLSDVGRGTRLYGATALWTVAMSTGTMKNAVGGCEYVCGVYEQKGEHGEQRTSIHTRSAQVGIVDGEVVGALRRLRSGERGHEEEKKGFNQSLNSGSSHNKEY